MATNNTRDKVDVTKWLVIAGIAVVVIVGAIELNARRQAAATTREFLRPATAEEKEQMDAQMAEFERTLTSETPDDATVRAAVWEQPSQPQRRRTPTLERVPIAPDERCISGQRFRRLPNGWEEIGSC